MTSMRISLLATALVCGLAATAVAQSDDLARKTAAEAAFRQGKDQIAAGQVAEACDSFRKSQELDPQLGTQYNLALCYDRLGKVASAWGLFSVLSETDTNKGRKADSAKRARALEPRLVRLHMVAAGDTPGLIVLRDGVDVTAAIGVATPVDPGTVALEASAEGYKPWTLEVEVAGEGSIVKVEIPALEKLPEPDPPPPPPDDRIVVEPPPPPPPPKDPGAGRRRLGLITAGAGVALVGAGAVFGVMARGDNDAAKDECGGSVADCRGDLAAARDLVSSARTKALVSTIGMSVGAAAVAGGVILYLTAPKARERGVAIVPTLGGAGGGVAVTGRF